MPDLTGQILHKRYRIDAFLGRGGMAEVYRAWDMERSAYVALKVLNEDLAADYVFLRRFAREARALELLQHPHIVRFFGFEEAGDTAFLVMEYIEGATLRRQLKLLGRSLTLPEALTVLQPVSSALNYAHQMGVFHCDVKPANVFIERGGRVVLGDFGVSRLTESATVTFSTPGTPAYMAPEQCRGEDVDAHTDIYALGITAYEMLTLDRPFKGNTEATTGSVGERVRWEQVHLPPPLPSSVNPQIMPETDEALLRALQKKPEERYQSAMALYTALSQEGRVKAAASVPWVEREPEPPAVAVPDTAQAQPAARKPLGLWLALGGLAAITAALALCAALIVPPLLNRTGSESTAEPQAVAVEEEPTAEIAPEEPTQRPTETFMPSLIPTPTDTPEPTFTPSPTPRYPGDVAGRIVFSRKTTPWSNDTAEIWVVDLDTESETQLTHNDSVDWIPTWSPDGSRIAFSTNREGNHDIWVMNADGSDQRGWITLPAWDEYPRWSPDGTEILIATTGNYQGVWNSEIYAGSSNGSLRRLTYNKYPDGWPTWSPDGRWVACSSDRDGYQNIYIFSALDGSNITNWTGNTTDDMQPAWSPDGEWIAFIRLSQSAPGEQAHFGDVWIGRADGAEFYRLTDYGNALDPAWSPDGRYIIFSHFWDSTGDGEVTAEDAADLWAISTDGAGPFFITEGTSQDAQPQWMR